MNLLGLLSGRATWIILAGLCAALAVAAGGVVAQGRTIGKLQEQNTGLRNELAQKELDLQSCERTRDRLRESLESCLNEVRVAKEENDLARQSVDLLADRVRQTTEALTRERAALFRATPSCNELAALDINAVCPGIAHSLRDRAARMSAAREGTNANPGAP